MTEAATQRRAKCLSGLVYILKYPLRRWRLYEHPDNQRSSVQVLASDSHQTTLNIHLD